MSWGLYVILYSDLWYYDEYEVYHDDWDNYDVQMWCFDDYDVWWVTMNNIEGIE